MQIPRGWTILFTNKSKYVHTCSQKLKYSRECKNLHPIHRSIFAHFSYSLMQLKQQILITLRFYYITDNQTDRVLILAPQVIGYTWWFLCLLFFFLQSYTVRKSFICGRDCMKSTIERQKMTFLVASLLLVCVFMCTTDLTRKLKLVLLPCSF